MIKVVVRSEEAVAAMKKLKGAMSSSKTSPVIQKVAYETLVELVKETPKQTGQTRRHWVVERASNTWQVTNRSKVMLWLEKGTKAHGAKSGGFLYIPLKPSAMIYRQGLKFGRDFVLAKRVRGIKAKKIVEKEQPRAEKRMLDTMREYIRNAIISANN